MTLPHFKYHPDPISSGVFEQRPILCSVCGLERDYAYVGPIYAVKAVEADICPWCIADGAAAAKYNAEFGDTVGCEDITDKAATTEYLRRTPGYKTWQGQSCLSHHGDFCAFIRYASWDDVTAHRADLKDDLETSLSELDWAEPELQKAMLHEHISGYLLQCVHCGKYRMYWDFD